MKKDNQALVLIIIVSIVLPAIVGILFFADGIVTHDSGWVYSLPHINAFINSTSAILLVAGRYQIKRGRKEVHQRLMITALAVGVIFLVNYVIYHASVPSTSYGGVGALRYIYFFLLITHILTAIGTVPFVLLAFFHALRKNFTKHKKVVKYAFPLWLYVAVTGVLVYLLIRPYY